jgi:riboflavin biosynthesis pyrimidine reductase
VLAVTADCRMTVIKLGTTSATKSGSHRVLEILRSNDPVLLSFASTVLADGGIETLMADQHISALEGAIGIFPRRIMVEASQWRQARRLLTEAGIEAWLLAADDAGLAP